MPETPLRIKLTGRVSALDGLLVQGGGSPLFTAGASARVEIAAFEPDGLSLLDLTGVASITLEVRADRNAGELLFPEVTVSDINTALTLQQWRDGQACHAVFELDAQDTNVPVTGARRTAWASIYALTTPGENAEKIPLGAGNIVIQSGGGGAPLPPPDTETQYLSAEQTRAEIEAAAEEVAANVAELSGVVEVIANPVPGIENVVYLAARTDGRDGKGTKTDPFNVSTPERFDAVLESLGASPVFLQFEAGVYNVNHHHADRWHVRNGWHAAGRGMDKTIFQIVNYLTGGVPGWWHTDPGGRFSTYPDDYCYFGSLRDLTIDGMQTDVVPDRMVNGVIMRGSYLTVENVEVRRCGGGLFEAFPLALGHDWRIDEPCDLKVLNCVVRDTQCNSQGSTAIAFTGGGNTAPQFGVNKRQRAVAQGNTIIGGGYLGVANFHGWEFIDNYVDMAGLGGQAHQGVNIDTGNCVNGRIEGNTFLNCAHGHVALGAIILGGGQVYDNILIKNNKFHIHKNISYGVLKLQGNTSNIDFFDNIIEVEGGTNSNWKGILFEGDNNDAPRLRGNRMADGSALIAALADNMPGNATLRGNQTVEGNQAVSGRVRTGPALSVSELNAYSVATFSGDGTNGIGVAGGLLQKGGGFCSWVLKRSGSTPSQWSISLPTGSTALQLNTETEALFHFTTSGELLGLLSNSTATFDRFKPGHGIFARAGSDWPTLSDLQDGYWCLWLKIPDNKFRFYARNGGGLHYLELTPASP